MTKKEWNEGIKQAKEIVRLLRLNNQQRMQICAIAINICDEISRGGRVSQDTYTLKRFANEIDINEGTLYEWCRYYRYVYTKLSQPQRQRFSEMPAASTREFIKGITEQTKPQVIRRRFDKFALTSNTDARFKKYVQVLNTIKHNLEDDKKASEISTNIIEDTRKACHELVELCKEEEGRREPGKKFRKPRRKKRPTAEQIWNEVGV